MSNSRTTDAATEPAAHGARLRLLTLGAASLSAEGSAVPSMLGAGKPLALVTYLACAPGRSASRAHLVDLLWADLGPEAAKHALRQTLWYLRRRLGVDLFAADGDRVSLTAPLAFDRDELLACVDAGDAAGVVERYRGEFLAEFAVPGGGEFERWADVERARLRLAFQRAAESTIHRLLQGGRLRDAADLARRARDADRLRERGWRLVLETLLATNDTLAATFEAEAFERLATAEGIVPEPATRAVLRQVRESTTRPVEPEGAAEPALAAQLVGREREFAAVLAAWERAKGGRVSRVQVEAPPGLGKSRLLGDVATRLRAARARVVLVRANAGSRDVSYAFAGELAGALARLPGAIGISPSAASALVALNPSLSATYAAPADHALGDEALRRRAIAVRELVTAVAEEQPLAILADDMHWCDAASRTLLRVATSRLERQRLLLVTASRATPGDEPEEEATRLVLAPLSTVAVGELVASIAALPADPWAERLVGALALSTGGSPLLVLETLHLLLERGLLERTPNGWTARDPAALLAALAGASAVRERVALLPADAFGALLLLSVAGATMPAERLAGAAGLTAGALDAVLQSLEKRGLVEHRTDSWRVAHDEYATAVIALAPDAERRAAEAAVGRAIARDPSPDDRAMRQAAVHLRRGGDEAGLRVLFVRYLRRARALGDRRRDAELAREFVPGASDTEVRALVRALPGHYRLGLYSPARVATAVVAVGLALALVQVASWVASREDPVPDAVLLAAGRSATGRAELHTHPIFAHRWGDGRPFDIGARRVVASDSMLERMLRKVPTFRPGNPHDWVLPASVPGPETVEVFARIDGREVRLTRSVGDDETPRWSPDGRLIAFVTAAGDSLSRYDIAVLDVATRAVRRLTSGPASDLAPYWSPDGSRIAFTRKHWDRDAEEACVVGFDGRDMQCRGADAAQRLSVLGWLDDHELLALLQPSSPEDALGARVVRLRVPGSGVATVLENASSTTLSPDGRYVICECVPSWSSRPDWYVVSLDAPRDLRRLRAPALRSSRVRFSWGPGARARPWLERLGIRVDGLPTVGVPHQLQPQGVDAGGATREVPYVRWASSDTSVATIDARGVLRPRRAGRVRVTADAGGWRVAHREIAISPGRLDTLLSESWDRSPDVLARWTVEGDSVWMPFGEPSPRLVRDQAGAGAFLNDGDGSHMSGVLSRREFPIDAGLALDARISVPVNRTAWQLVNATLTTGMDSLALARLDRRVGEIPGGGAGTYCSGTYPAGPEGVRFGHFRGASTGIQARLIDAPPSYRSGEWIRIRVQLLPDGRCGVAFDGAALWISDRPIVPRRDARVLLDGSSRGTRALVGAVLLRRGVPRDVDWSVLGRPHRDASESR